MESNPNNPPGSKFARSLFRPIGVIAVLFTGYRLILYFAFRSATEATTPIEKVAFPLIYLVAAVYVVGFVISILRRMGRRAVWINRLLESLLTWRVARRVLVGVAILATLTAIFYAEENWRGKRAWEQCKRDLEAKGEVLDWNAYIPPPVPDAQNIFKAPKMREWFVGRTSTGYPRSSWTRDTNVSPVVVAEVTVGSNKTHLDPGQADVVLRFDDPAARAEAKKLIDAAVGPAANGPRRDFTFIARPFDQIKRVRILVEAEKLPTPKEILEMFPDDIIAPGLPWGNYPNRGRLQIESIGSNTFSVSLKLSEVVAATDYLERSDWLTPDFNLVREALKRPQSRMDSDFQRPFEMPIVNFVAIRILAQEATSRAQCCLLLGKSEQAFHELSLIIDLRRLLASKPTTLVAAMIDVAICGLYVDTIADGFRLRAWREPELVALQKQLAEINLPPRVVEAFRSGRAAVCQTFQFDSAKDFVKRHGVSGNPLEKLANPVYLLLKFAPRGWTYQNIVVVARLEQATAIQNLNSKPQLIDPNKVESANREVEKARGPSSPFNILARIAVPNFGRAIQVTAQNQTKVNQALIVCGLERYRLAHDEYPEALDALVPQFVEKLPRDTIGGQPMKYRRTEDGKFLLYSVGWNEKDDGGVPGKNLSGENEGDWVWSVPQK